MMPVIVSWSKGQILIELILDLPGSSQLNIYSINLAITQSKKISNDQELIQSDPTSCTQNQKGDN